VRLARFDRPEFLGHRFDWNPGEHVCFCEPTQQGKSYLAHQMIGRVLDQYEGTNLQFASLMPKPRDPATSEWMPRLNLRETPVWPPLPRLFGKKPAGHVVWPRHNKTLAPAANREQLAAVIRKCLAEQYWRGDSLTFADDVHITAVLLKLNDQFEEFLTAGGGMKSAIWYAAQKPSGSQATGSLSTFAYSAPTHLIFGHDPDERNLKRLSEIGGVNADLVAGIVRSLPVHRIMTPSGPKNVSEKLYIHKLGYMCIVGL
jgi:hypothetical protein